MTKTTKMQSNQRYLAASSHMMNNVNTSAVF